MSEAAVKRLADLIKEPLSQREPGPQGSETSIEGGFHIEEGWISAFLLATVIFSTVWSVQVAKWVDHLEFLSFSTLLGLVVGIFAAKQRYIHRLLFYGAVMVFGLFLTFWLTSLAYYNGSLGEMMTALVRWFNVIVSGDLANDNAIFLLLITFLGFGLAVVSAWLVYSVRAPWLMIVANAAVLLINLNNVDSGFIIFLVIFLLASLLLLLRLNLHASTIRWKRQGLRYPDDLGWDVMQAGTFISIAILVVSWILPGAYKDPLASQVWSTNNSPLVQMQDVWNRVISLNGGQNPSNHGNFLNTLTLGGNPNLNNEIVLKMQTDSTDASALYLANVSYEKYSHGQWTIDSTSSGSVKGNSPALPPSATMTQTIHETITLVNPPGQQYPYILGPAEIDSMSLDSTIWLSNGGIVTWLSSHGNLPSGTTYKVTSSISTADEQTLRTVPMPQDAPRFQADPHNPDAPIPTNAFSPVLVTNFTQWPQGVDKQRFATLAQAIIGEAGAMTMYDKMTALENYFHKNYHYSTDIHPPTGKDPTTWFLFESDKKGFCNYYASAMTLLARSIGIPARVITGYAPGTRSDPQGAYVVHGQQAHAWVQIYFAGYGWINFEPSPSFADFPRPAPGSSNSSGLSGVAATLPSGIVPPGMSAPAKNTADLNTSANNAGPQAQTFIRQDLSIGLGGLVLVLLFSVAAFAIWWRRLFRHYSLASQLYGRLCLLAQGAGVRMQPSQTPYEYLQELAVSALPREAATLEHLGDIYVRERWAAVDSPEHPSRSDELQELPALWRRLRPRLWLYVLAHPYFLLWGPRRLAQWLGQRWRALRQRNKFTSELRS